MTLTCVLPVQRRRISRMFVPGVTDYILSSLVGILFIAGYVTDVTTTVDLKKRLMEMSWSGDVRRTRNIQFRR